MEGGPTGNRTYYRSPGQATGTPKLAGSSNKSLDVNSTGNVNGLPVLDISLEQLDDKPWRKPGKISYFNVIINFFALSDVNRISLRKNNIVFSL